ncbi:unnamed protein product [Blepharisma stoltei]|uniref:Uncharacterized protein n=1 Tax=Blepharisma stoltei TaxID=1481888 RepID=A0AAU9IY05_9CILI|nr:unnamed protein product [Blepharisma stoltei]
MEWNHNECLQERGLSDQASPKDLRIANGNLMEYLQELCDKSEQSELWEWAVSNLNEKKTLERVANELQTLSKIILISSSPKRGNHSDTYKIESKLFSSHNLNAHCCYKRKAKELIEPLSSIDYKIAQIIVRDLSDWTSIETTKNTYFNKININSLSNVLASFKGLLSSKSQGLLFNLILLSRESDEITAASSNAATILARINYSFVNQNLSRIKIPNANLSGSLFINTNLENSDLTNTVLSQSHFYFTNFESCKMDNCKFGQLPEFLPKETCKTKECQACFSPCGKYLAISTSKSLKIRDMETCKNFRKMKHEGSSKIFWSPCGNFICSVSENNVKMIDTKNSYQEVKHKVDVNPKSFCFSKNWKYWGSCKQTWGIQCYSVNPWKKLYGMSNGKEFYKYYYGGKFLFSNCENYMIIGNSSAIYIFKINPWSPIKQIKCNWYSYFSLSFTPSSDYIFLTFLNCVQLMNIWSEESIEILKEPSSIEISLYEKEPLIYEPDGYTIKTIDLGNQKIAKTFFGNSKNSITSIACSPCGKYIAPVVSSLKIETYESPDICSNIEINGHLGIIKSVEISESGNYMITSSTDLSILWDIQNKSQIKKLLSINHYGNYHRSAISSTDSYFLVFNDNWMFIGNIKERKVIKKTFKDCFSYASFSYWSSGYIPDKFLTVYSSKFRCLKVLDIENGTTKRASSLMKSTSKPLGFSPCGTYFFSKYSLNSKFWRISIWNTKIMKKLAPFDTNMKSITDFAASYPAQQFIFALIEEKRTVKIFNIVNYANNELSSIGCAFWKNFDSIEEIGQVAFSYCQRYLIACQEDKLITIWHLETENVVLRISSLHKATTIMKFAVTSCSGYIVITENNFFWVLNLKYAMDIFERNDKTYINCEIYKLCLVWHSRVLGC